MRRNRFRVQAFYSPGKAFYSWGNLLSLAFFALLHPHVTSAIVTPIYRRGNRRPETSSHFPGLTQLLSGRQTQTRSTYAFPPHSPRLHLSRGHIFLNKKQKQTKNKGNFAKFHSGFPKKQATDTQMSRLAKSHVLESLLQAWVGFWEHRQTIQAALAEDGEP